MGKWKKKLEEWSLALRGVRRLNGEVESFPPGSEANAHGVVAVGGDLKPERLLAAYRRGLFPYYSEHQPILWRSPDPRFVIDLSRFRVPHNVRRAVRQGPFDIRFDTAFEEVVRGAASSYRGPQVKTWLNEELIAAYVALHKLGYAHSSEAWDGDRLMGGAFGIALGTVWFGESMFTRASDAGNVAHVVLSQKLRAWGFTLIDCQHPSVHMARFGGESWSRARFEAHLAQAMRAPTKVGPWQLDEPWHPGGKTPGRAVESSLPTQ